MTIDQALYNHIVSLGFAIRLGSAEGQNFPYYTVIKIEDPERAFSLCTEQGDSGQALFILEGHTGGNKQAASASGALTYTQLLHDAVKGIKGVIGAAPNQFRIWNNVTSGVTLKDRGAQELLIWSCEFSLVIWWDVV